MRRTNVYLDDEQLQALRALADQRGEPVAKLVREAVDSWLAEQSVRPVPSDAWRARFGALLTRRARIAGKHGFDPSEVERDVSDAVQEVRRARAARR
jgi:hypothetical protein